MIRVTETESEYKVTGHAGAGPKGHDIVCAGISALVGALCLSLQVKNKEAQFSYLSGLFSLDKATLNIEGKTLLDATKTGINAIRESYPECFVK